MDFRILFMIMDEINILALLHKNAFSPLNDVCVKKRAFPFLFVRKRMKPFKIAKRYYDNDYAHRNAEGGRSNHRHPD
jgi:hypothetical protein